MQTTDLRVYLVWAMQLCYQVQKAFLFECCIQLTKLNGRNNFFSHLALDNRYHVVNAQRYFVFYAVFS